ncbi:MAG: helix-turn-helix transcriptional regulator, partial [Bradyrhizobium sp.]
LDLVPNDEYFASRFYKEWAQPQGYLDSIHGVLDKSKTTYAALAIARHERHGRVDEEARRRTALLVPHFRRAVAIGKVIDLHKVDAATLGDTLDGLAAAVLIVDAAGRIAHANAAAYLMLDEAKVIRKAGNKLIALDALANRSFQDFFVKAGLGDAAVGTAGFALALTGGGERFIAHALPLTSGSRRRAGIAYSAVAAVFIRGATLDLSHQSETIASTFKLTQAEMRVLGALVEAGGITDVASVIGISEATVKTHLQHIFAKTNTKRQAELIKLVAGYRSPLGEG